MSFLNTKKSTATHNQLAEQARLETAIRRMFKHRRYEIVEPIELVKKTIDKKSLAKKVIQEERGSQLFEYIAILPMLFIAMLIGWQMFMVGHTFIVTANAAREGARTLAVCGGGNVQAAANRTSPGYRPQVLQASRGGSTTTVRIGNDIPKIRIVGFLDPNLPQVTMKATMRTEKCR